MRHRIVIAFSVLFLCAGLFGGCSRGSLNVGDQNGDNAGPGDGGDPTGPSGSDDPAVPLSLCDNKTPIQETRTILPGAIRFHNTGQVFGDAWRATTAYPNGAMTYGTYANDLPVGGSIATFTLKLDNVSDAVIPVTLDIFDVGHNDRLVIRSLQRNAFPAANQSSQFSLAFTNPASPICDWEFRVIYLGQSTVTHLKTVVNHPTSDHPFEVDGEATNFAAFKQGFMQATQFTISTWFSTTGPGVILGYQNVDYPNTPTQYVPAIYVGSDGKLYGYLWKASSESPISSSSKVNDGQWHHVALVAAGNIQTLYLDGVAVGTRSGDINAAQMSFNQFGSGYTGVSWPQAGQGWMPFPGKLAKFAIDPTVRSATEIQALFANGVH